MADLRTLLAAIPQAADGLPITSNYHNTLKTALEALAGQLGEANVGPLVVTFPMAFIATSGGRPPWRLDYDGSAASNGPQCEGWFGIDLPDGVRVDRVTFYGRRLKLRANANDVVSWVAELTRQPVLSGKGTPGVLFAANLADPDSDGEFEENAIAQQAARVVDKKTYKYLIRSKILGANPATDAVQRLLACQIECNSRSSPQITTNILFPFVTNAGNINNNL